MAFQALRRSAAARLRLGASRNLVPRGLVPSARSSPAIMAPVDTRAPLWAMAARFSSAAKEVTETGLVSILRAELDHERKTYTQSKEVAKGPPKPWTLTDKVGHADVILRRSYGQEDIAVTCVYQADADGYDGDPENLDDASDDDMGTGSACVTMSITINKGGADNPSLEISAASYGSEITIDHVYFWDDEKNSKEAIYDGPNFMQLDEELQSQFEKYIKARGINRDLTGYLFTLLADKEQREYMRWLQKVEGFLRQ